MPVYLVVTVHEVHRRARGLTAVALGRALGYAGHVYVSRVEGRNLAASGRYQAAAARLLGVPVEDLFDEDGFAR